MSTTKHTSFIPMSPDFLPRQKLNEVVTLPELPKGLAPKVDLMSCCSVIDLEHHPENLLFYAA